MSSEGLVHLTAADDGVEECSNCQRFLFEADMRECASSVPGHGRGPFHCWDCVAAGCCRACTDEDRRYEAEERGRRT